MGCSRVFFGAASDPARYYPALGHETLSKQVITGVREGESFQIVLGDFGSGKTTLAIKWLADIGNQFDTIFLPAKRYPDAECFLRDLSDELGLNTTDGLWAIRRQVEERLISGYEQRRRVLLLVDGAHQLPADILSDLLSFTELNGTNGNALSLILLGHQSLLDNLMGKEPDKSIRSFFTAQRIPHLELGELADFARHQIRMAGLDPDMIVDLNTLNLLASLSNGNIGVLVLLLRLSWRIARIHNLESIDIESVESACDSIPRIGRGALDDLNLPEPRLSPHGISA